MKGLCGEKKSLQHNIVDSDLWHSNCSKQMTSLRWMDVNTHTYTHSHTHIRVFKGELLVKGGGTGSFWIFLRILSEYESSTYMGVGADPFRGCCNLHRKFGWEIFFMIIFLPCTTMWPTLSQFFMNITSTTVIFFVELRTNAGGLLRLSIYNQQHNVLQ